MNSSNIRRIQNEYNKINNDKNLYADSFQINMVDENIFLWKVNIKGPENSLYENYNFELEIELSNDYPYSSPKVKFITPIQHMNVNDKGDICLNILKKDGWNASLNIISIIWSIIVLLDQPNPEDPFNSELASLYRNDKLSYDKKIRDYCKTHSKLWTF
ncbi:putative ubiquitin-conjugating enzyme E2 [Acanthamoeba castellanii mimivirus]|uniref:Probable ubiquitin-conjugating enzyme E2 L460 n=5 Tax=Mimivirus TaxID=315393 RepID=UBC1_MIMIV|nr:probable ubiquitin-conjugating enzyme E2 [Acanthamoeba polyphaga mimivirus]Q5UQC9.1 RecName: Full=Probable ubiquitin-conjugating enzyme E2 L460; AltName: Full=E2 ubiquitin-conjugating enzyme L460; AltName: Full=Ubiquitin carrier protein; AltName: Full=Ubiquitin-protein ligase [Acanthamoeba polyphaga mimivirus]AEQ60647.1 Ubiquitin-conjugating enzyme [Acanthamoeba castellanii mamavirus]AHA45399.1 putative ubiquitin-conjugating enzyme E2 [Hirudovirus strain Sangsue]AHJ40145.1 ubiquitin-conjugat